MCSTEGDDENMLQGGAIYVLDAELVSTFNCGWDCSCNGDGSFLYVFHSGITEINYTTSCFCAASIGTIHVITARGELTQSNVNVSHNIASESASSFWIAGEIDACTSRMLTVDSNEGNSIIWLSGADLTICNVYNNSAKTRGIVEFYRTARLTECCMQANTGTYFVPYRNDGTIVISDLYFDVSVDLSISSLINHGTHILSVTQSIDHLHTFLCEAVVLTDATRLFTKVFSFRKGFEISKIAGFIMFVSK